MENLCQASSNLQISKEVIISITSLAAKEVDGVVDFATHTSIFDEMLNVTKINSILKSKYNSSSGIKVDIKDGTAKIDVFIIIKPDAKIPSLALELQNSVKSSVQSMTGIEVSKVNVHVSGVALGKGCV